MTQGPMSSILVTIRITVRIRQSVPDHDPDPGRTATIPLCWRSAEVCALRVLLVGFLFVNDSTCICVNQTKFVYTFVLIIY